MFLDVNGNRMHYEKNGSGQAIILLHGNGENLTIFRESIALLKNHFTVYAIDMADHGESYRPKKLHYESHVADIYAFIHELNIERPVLYGFSDGGIVGVMLAYKCPDLLSKLIISGVNIDPLGLKVYSRLGMKIKYAFTKSEKTRMMLTEPNISAEDLSKIVIPTFITAGQFDVIRPAHTRFIADHIRGSQLQIFKHQTHGSYVVHSDKIAKYILQIL